MAKCTPLPIVYAKRNIVSTLTKLKNKQQYLEESCRVLLAQLTNGCTGAYGGTANLFDVYEDSHKIGDLLAELGFQDIAVKVFKQIIDLGTKLNDIARNVWSLTINLCDVFGGNSEQLCRCLENVGAVERLTEGIQLISNLDINDNTDYRYIINHSMGILYKIAKITDSKDRFKRAKTAQIIMKQEVDRVLGTDEYIRTFLLPYVVDETEYDRIADKKDFIVMLIYYLRNSFGTVQSKADTFLGHMVLRVIKPWEFIRCLSKLALNDLNKKKIIERGALVEFVKVFSRNDVREVRNVTECLWTLASEMNVRSAIKDAPGIVSSLVKLKFSDDAVIRRNVSETLRMITEENDPKNLQEIYGRAAHIGEERTAFKQSPSTAQDDSQRHIFISYCWADTKVVEYIYTILKEKGYTIWIDRTHMTGSTLDAMAKAVENASVVLICMSEKYKESQNCRKEAEYTYNRKKEYIPLIMQRNYKPDGWLGAMLGTQLFFDFSGKYPLETKSQELLREVETVLVRKCSQIQEQRSLRRY